MLLVVRVPAPMAKGSGSEMRADSDALAAEQWRAWELGASCADPEVRRRGWGRIVSKERPQAVRL